MPTEKSHGLAGQQKWWGRSGEGSRELGPGRGVRGRPGEGVPGRGRREERVGEVGERGLKTRGPGVMVGEAGEGDPGTRGLGGIPV